MVDLLSTAGGAGRLGLILPRLAPLDAQGGCMLCCPPSLLAISLATAMDLAKESSTEIGCCCLTAASSSLMNSAATFSATLASTFSFFFHVNFPNEVLGHAGPARPASADCLRSLALMAGLGPQRTLGGSKGFGSGLMSSAFPAALPSSGFLNALSFPSSRSRSYLDLNSEYLLDLYLSSSSLETYLGRSSSSLRCRCR